VSQAGSIITARIVLIISALAISASDNYYTSRPCTVLSYTHKSEAQTLEYYPACASFFNGTNLGQEAIVHASMSNGISSEIGAALGVSFGMALWMALIIHAVGVEVYVSIRPICDNGRRLIFGSCTLHLAKLSDCARLATKGNWKLECAILDLQA
jgi:hypothetical protein